MLMRSWMERYDKYQKEIQECEKIKDVAEKANALLRAEESFDLWMDIYPESETWLVIIGCVMSNLELYSSKFSLS